MALEGKHPDRRQIPDPRSGPRGWSRPGTRATIRLESLESRRMLYALAGTEWASTDISYSFAPDGTAVDGGRTSALFSHLDALHMTDLWQREYARALQTWAQYAPLNFHLVTDDGSPQGTSGPAQGDPRFGDIRFFAAPTGSLGSAYYPSTTTRSGDMTLSTSYAFNIGSVYDLYSVLLHETGHSLGLDHSADTDSVTSSAVATRVATGLSPDDIAGIQAIYGARQPDAYDAAAPNDSVATATVVALGSTSVACRADLTSLADVDHYRITVPSGSGGTLTVSIDARGLSLLAPAVRVYDAGGHLVASASAGDAYGTVATVNLAGLSEGETYVIVADGATDDVFGMGAYRLNASFGTSTSPPPDPEPTPTPDPEPEPLPDPDPLVLVEPDRFESNDLFATAADLGRTSGFAQVGLSLHTASDKDFYRFVPTKNGTYAISSLDGTGMDVRLTVFDSAQRVLASGPTIALGLTGGQVYYVSVTDATGAVGEYDLSLEKTRVSGGGGGKRGFLHAPHMARAELSLEDLPDSDATDGHELSELGLSRAWSALTGLEHGSEFSSSLIDVLKQLVRSHASTARL